MGHETRISDQIDRDNDKYYAVHVENAKFIEYPDVVQATESEVRTDAFALLNNLAVSKEYQEYGCPADFDIDLGKINKMQIRLLHLGLDEISDRFNPFIEFLTVSKSDMEDNTRYLSVYDQYLLDLEKGA